MLFIKITTRFNNYSSIECFGRITGIDQIGYTFYISIGTNTLINLFLQSSFWIVLLSFFKKKEEYQFNFTKIITSSIVSLLYCVLIYSEFRYYQKTIFEMDLSLYNSYKYIYIYLLSIIFLGSNIFESRDEKIINFFHFFLVHWCF